MAPRITKRRSSISNERPARPTNPEFDNFTNFRFSHSKQRNTLPNVLGRGSDSGVTWGPCGGPGPTIGDNEGNDPGATKVNEG